MDVSFARPPWTEPAHPRRPATQATRVRRRQFVCSGGSPPFPFPPPGESRGGRVPPTPAARCAASKKRWHASCAVSPHKRGCRPLVDPLRALRCKLQISVTLDHVKILVEGGFRSHRLPAQPRGQGERNLRFLSPLESPFFPLVLLALEAT